MERTLFGVAGDGCHSNSVPPPLLRSPPSDLVVVGSEQIHQKVAEPKLHRQQRVIGLPLEGALQC